MDLGGAFSEVLINVGGHLEYLLEVVEVLRLGLDFKIVIDQSRVQVVVRFARRDRTVFDFLRRRTIAPKIDAIILRRVNGLRV